MQVLFHFHNTLQKILLCAHINLSYLHWSSDLFQSAALYLLSVFFQLPASAFPVLLYHNGSDPDLHPDLPDAVFCPSDNARCAPAFHDLTLNQQVLYHTLLLHFLLQKILHKNRSDTIFLQFQELPSSYF